MPQRPVQIISHGPSCLDGVMAAAAVARYYADQRVSVTLPGNSDADRTLQGLEIGDGAGAEIWITDLSWNHEETAARLNELAERGAKIYWIDHHRSAVSRADAPQFKVRFAGKVLSERYSAARLVFNYLRKMAADSLSAARRAAFEKFEPFALLADDHDRWVHRMPESPDWALAVQTLGGINSYREIVRLDEPHMTKRLRGALVQGQEAMRKSLEIAHATLVDRELANGVKVRTACCFGYSSEVAANLYEGQKRTVVALFDLRSQGVSLRRSEDCDVDLSLLAQGFGGGGHAAASGFQVNDLRRIPAERLAQLVGDRLESGPPQ